MTSRAYANSDLGYDNGVAFILSTLPDEDFTALPEVDAEESSQWIEALSNLNITKCTPKALALDGVNTMGILFQHSLRYFTDDVATEILGDQISEARETMLLSEPLFQKEWDDTDEDEAWAHL